MGECRLDNRLGRLVKVKAKVIVKVAQSCPTLCALKDYTVHRILQARILEWVALSLHQEIFPTQVSHIAG